MIRTVHLHGSLKEHSGEPFHMDADLNRQIGSPLRQCEVLVGGIVVSAGATSERR